MDIITLGIGPDSDIEHLVLTGLGVAEIPSVDNPEYTQSINPGEPQIIINAVPSQTGLPSAAFALPPYPVRLEWQIIYATLPTVAYIGLEVSVDGIHFFEVDNLASPTPSISNIFTTASFVRAKFGEMDPDIITTVIIICTRVKRSL